MSFRAKSRHVTEINRPSAAPAAPWTPARLRRMRAFLATWYVAAKRDLPWRRTTDPYAIAVSELMLQQTQVVTVIPYYARWLKRFPNWAALAGASEDAILKAWEGLGYYRRARHLQALARAVVAAGGSMPPDETKLLALPGIGPYTAAAIGSIAFNLPLAVLDGNVMRVLTRLLACSDDVSRPQTRRKLQAEADLFLDRRDPATHNQALMELGATVCLPRKPMCLLCPLKDDCRGRDHADDFPVKSRVEMVRREETVAIVRAGDKIYGEQVPAGAPWHGLWRFPDFDPSRMNRGQPLARLRYGITKYAVAMQAVAAEWKPRIVPTGRYLTGAEMERLAFAAPHRKLIGLLSAGKNRDRS
jgi:A/G-specific adenine glycosylase